MAISGMSKKIWLIVWACLGNLCVIIGTLVISLILTYPGIQRPEHPIRRSMHHNHDTYHNMLGAFAISCMLLVVWALVVEAIFRHAPINLAKRYFKNDEALPITVVLSSILYSFSMVSLVQLFFSRAARPEMYSINATGFFIIGLILSFVCASKNGGYFTAVLTHVISVLTAFGLIIYTFKLIASL